MTEQQKAPAADAESLLQRASDLCIEIVKRGPYATGNAANLRNDIDRYLLQVRHEAAIRATPQPSPQRDEESTAQEAALLKAAQKMLRELDSYTDTDSHYIEVGRSAVAAFRKAIKKAETAPPAAPVANGTEGEWECPECFVVNTTKFNDCGNCGARRAVTDTPASAVAEPVAQLNRSMEAYFSACGEAADARGLEAAVASYSVVSATEIGRRVALQIAELPDRDSPDGQPEMMLATSEEIRNAVENVMEELRAAAPPPIARSDAAPVSPDVSEAMVRHMVNRFLGWRLPKTFSPDNGISYARPNYAHPPADHDWPVGTHLFNAAEAEAMVRYMTMELHARQKALDD